MVADVVCLLPESHGKSKFGDDKLRHSTLTDIEINIRLVQVCLVMTRRRGTLTRCVLRSKGVTMLGNPSSTGKWRKPKLGTCRPSAVEDSNESELREVNLSLKRQRERDIQRYRTRERTRDTQTHIPLMEHWLILRLDWIVPKEFLRIWSTQKTRRTSRKKGWNTIYNNNKEQGTGSSYYLIWHCAPPQTFFHSFFYFAYVPSVSMNRNVNSNTNANVSIACGKHFHGFQIPHRFFAIWFVLWFLLVPINIFYVILCI